MDALIYILKSVRYLTVCIGVIIIMSACEETLDVDISQIDQQLVINGSVSTSVDKTQVAISLSSNVFTNESIKKISGAQVTISDDQGNNEILKENTAGVYKASSFYGLPNHTYTLNINCNGKTYTAVSRMPEQMSIDSIKFVKNYQTTIIGITIPLAIYNYDIKCYVKNKSGVEEYCMLKMTNAKDNSLIFRAMYNDKYSDGESIVIERKGLPLDSYTTYNLEIISVDKDVYNYLYQLVDKEKEFDSDIFELFNSGSFNPKSNVSNALGYFNAYSVKSYKVTLSGIKAN